MWVYNGPEPTKKDDFLLNINKEPIKCSKTVCTELSQKIKEKSTNDKYSIELKCTNFDPLIVQKLFTAQLIQISETNVEFFIELCKKLKIDSLKNHINNVILKSLASLEKVLYADHSEMSIEKILANLYDLKFISYKTICHSFLHCCFSRSDKIDELLDILVQFDKLLQIRDQPGILNHFHDVIISSLKIVDGDFLFTSELFFIVRKLVNQQIIKLSELVIFDLPPLFDDLFGLIEENEDKINKFKIDADKGIGIDEIAVSIRNDDLITFIELFKNYKKDSSEFIIKKDVFERSTLVNTGVCNFIEYAAFFGSVKIFKFLYKTNEEKPELLPIFAVAGGNIEIIEIVWDYSENQSDSLKLSFDGALNFAIEYHRLHIFKYLREKMAVEVNESELLSECIEFCNFSQFHYLILNPAIEMPSTIVAEIAKSDIIELIKWIVDSYPEKYEEFINSEFEETTPIQFACKNGSIEMVNFLLKCEHCNVNKKTITTTLNAAVDSGDPQILNAILEKGVENINDRDEYGFSALHQAVMKNDIEIVQLLLTQKMIDNNLRTKKEKMTALHIACQNGFIEIVQHLLGSYNVNINTFSVNGMTPLHSSIENNFPEIVKMLMNNLFININTVNDVGDAPIHTACKVQNIDIIRMLVENDVEINVLNAETMAPIHIACHLSNTNVFRELIKSKMIEINSKGAGWTPLHICCKNGNVDIIKELLEFNNLNLNPTGGNDIDGQLPIHITAIYDQTEAAKCILAAGSLSTNLSSLSSGTINNAAKNINAKKEQPKKEKKININQRNKEGLCPIHIAIKHKNIELIRAMLTRNDINLNMKTDEGDTSFHLAFKEATMEIVELLLSIVGININETDRNAMTILHQACQSNENNLVKKLLKSKDIEINCKNKIFGSFLLCFFT